LNLPTSDPRRLRELLVRYQRPHHGRSVAELLCTALPLALFWGLALLSAASGWWWGVLAVVPAALFLVRLFMIQHDCGHGAFFGERVANEWTGRIIGLLTMTAYDYWRRTHALHHATSGNLDRRGLGGVETLTAEEYRAHTRLGRLAYRLYRHPLVMFGLGPSYMFVLQHRLPIGLLRDRRAWLSVLGNNLGLSVLVLAEVVVAGPKAVLLAHLPIMALAGSVGVWLFYVQHQFDGAHWARNDRWDAAEAALHGSSHLDLPPVLRWFTANIGAHHIHHLRSKIPFYRLPQVLRDFPQLREVSRITLADAARAARLSLWDEGRGRLVSFSEAQRETALG
jgi:omega-6 fatty acid desaturase (delta-12 desaturase)